MYQQKAKEEQDKAIQYMNAEARLTEQLRKLES